MQKNLQDRLIYLKKVLLHIEESQKLNVDLYFTAFMKGKLISVKNEIYFLESII